MGEGGKVVQNNRTEAAEEESSFGEASVGASGRLLGREHAQQRVRVQPERAGEPKSPLEDLDPQRGSRLAGVEGSVCKAFAEVRGGDGEARLQERGTPSAKQLLVALDERNELQAVV